MNFSSTHMSNEEMNCTWFSYILIDRTEQTVQTFFKVEELKETMKEMKGSIDACANEVTILGVDFDGDLCAITPDGLFFAVWIPETL